MGARQTLAAIEALVEALGLVVFARDQILRYEDAKLASVIGWSRVIQLRIEHAFDSWHGAHAISADDQKRREQRRDCLGQLLTVRGALANALDFLPENPSRFFRLHTVRKALLDAQAKLAVAIEDLEVSV